MMDNLDSDIQEQWEKTSTDTNLEIWDKSSIEWMKNGVAIGTQG